jgi:undecaprenyl-diphosphatase
MNALKTSKIVFALGACLFAACALADPNVIDHKWKFDNSGIWDRNVQLFVVNGLIAGSIAGALWEGGDSRLGRTFWQSVDSAALGGVSSEVLKHAIQRPRPAQSDDPDEVRQGNGHYSFPSGEVTAVTAVITPFVLEYAHDNPLVYALYALPAYDAVARLKSQAHWQTDVLAGFALGTLTGYYAHERDSPFILGVLPGGFSVGLKTRF